MSRPRAWRERRDRKAAPEVVGFGAPENRRFDVAVWNHEGDVVKSLWAVTWEEAEFQRELYADEPLLTVVVEER